MISSLQYLRALAAVAVVISHVGANTTRLFDTSPGSFSFGAIGVDIFFILSGFVMMLVTQRRERGPIDFFKRRFTRIMPVYWAAVLFYLAWDAAVWRLGISWDPATLLWSIVLWGTETGSVVVGVAWTLRFEFAFYACFAIALWISHTYRAHLAGLFVLTVIAALKYYGGDHALLLQARNWSGGWYEFLFGMALFTLWRDNAFFGKRITLTPGASAALIAITSLMTLAFLALFNLAGPLAPAIHEKQLFWGLPAVAVFGGWLLLFGRCQVTGPAERLLRHIGDASYSLYLVHLPVASTLASVPWLADVWEATGIVGYLLISTTLCVMAGSLFYILVERPLLRLLGHGQNRRTVEAIAASRQPS